MHISYFCFILFDMKIFGEIVTTHMQLCILDTLTHFKLVRSSALQIEKKFSKIITYVSCKFHVILKVALNDVKKS